MKLLLSKKIYFELLLNPKEKIKVIDNVKYLC